MGFELYDWNEAPRGQWPQLVDETWVHRPWWVAKLEAEDWARLSRMGITQLHLSGEVESVQWLSAEAFDESQIEAGTVWVGFDDRGGEGPAIADWAMARLKERRPQVSVAWRGSDRQGLALEGALRAVELGVDRVQGSFLGLGGGLALDQLMVNLDLMFPKQAPSGLDELGDHLERLASLGLVIPANYPVFGSDAFRTGTGVHAAAIVKALDQGRHEVADRVYSGVVASRYRRKQILELGPMSGMATVRYWCSKLGMTYEDAKGQSILDYVKTRRAVLSEPELKALFRSVFGGDRGSE